MDENLDYCRNIVATHDYDRYVLAQAAPASMRAGLYALFAFNYEIAKTRELVREMQAGHVRLTWWQDTLDAFYNGAPMPAHEVAVALGDTIKKYALPQPLFTALIEARRADLDTTAPASLEAMAAYADGCNTPLLALAACLTGEQFDERLASLGTATGLIGLIRALPFMARQGRCTLPAPLLYSVGLMPEQISHIEPSEKLCSAIETIAQVAQTHLDTVDYKNGVLARQKKLTAFYLRRLACAGHNPFDPLVCRPVPFLGLRILF